MKYRLVSHHWNQQLSSGEFKQFAKLQPTYALALLKRDLYIGEHMNLDLLKTCRHLLDIRTARNLLLNIDDPMAFQHLHSIPVLNDHQLSKKAYWNILFDVVNDGTLSGAQLPRSLKAFGSVDANFRNIIRTHFNSIREHLCIHNMSLTQIILLVFLEDMYSNEDMTFIFEFVTKQIMIALRTFKLEKIAYVLEAMNTIVLPYSGAHLLFTSMELSFFIAAYTGETDLIKAINIDYNLVIECASSARMLKFIEILIRIQRGELKEFPAKDLFCVETLLESQIAVPIFGFKYENIVARSKLILDDDEISDDIKELVRVFLV